MKIRIIFRFITIIFLTVSAAMLFPLGWALYDQSSDISAFSISIVSGLVLAYLSYNMSLGTEKEDMGAREAIGCVAFSWIAASFLGAMPFFFGKYLPTSVDAYFEAMSGFSTTGATVFQTIDGLPRGILMWRAEMQWLGGMGIVILVISILPLFGINMTHLFKAESPGPTLDKVSPRIAEMATLLWKIYMGITVIGTLLLWLGGMTFFGAIAHCFAAVSTGGYSTRTASVEYYHSAFIDYVLTAIMFISGTNFNLHLAALRGKTLKHYLKDSEFVFYALLTLAASVAVTLSLHASRIYPHIFDAFRYASFQVVSIITTTGFITDDYSLWPVFSQFLLLLLMFAGGCAGSTSGAVKCVRFQILVKEMFAELKRMIHPNAVIPVFQSGKTVPRSMITSTGSFITVYVIIWAFSALAVTLTGEDIVSAISAVSATLSNVGPGLADVGPESNFANQAACAKWIYIFDMLAGRLELYTLLILFTKDFWKK